MPSKWRVRRVFGPLVRALARGCVRLGMRPNHATVTTLVLSGVAAVALWLTGLEPLFAALVFLTGLFDGVDGSMARMTKSATRRGGFLDSTCDRISEIFLYGAFLLHLSPQRLVLWVPVHVWTMLALTGSILTSYARARASVELPHADLDVGLMARSERLFTIVIFGTLGRLAWAIPFLAATTNLTAIYRLRLYGKLLSSKR